jgi:hypothetical protein
MTNASLVTITLVSGLLLSLNPVSISVFVALLSGSMGKGHSKIRTNITALCYLVSLFGLYTLAGMLLVIGFDLLDTRSVQNLGLAVASLSVIWGLMNIKDFYWYGPRRDAPGIVTKSLHSKTVKKNSPRDAIALALASAYATLPSVGIPLLAYSTIVALVRPGYLNWPILLALVLMTPLIVIAALTNSGLKLSAILKWKEESKAIFRLCIGITMVVLGWLLFLLINGTLESTL